jgi:hypothetical protein
MGTVKRGSKAVCELLYRRLFKAFCRVYTDLHETLEKPNVAPLQLYNNCYALYQKCSGKYGEKKM